MIRLREALRSSGTDEGFTLVEAIVAMAILALLSTGIITGTNMVSRMTADNRSREIAVNLAEAQLDLDRGILDPFKITAFGVGSADPVATPAVVTTVSGRAYSVSQSTSLVGVDGADISCGSGKTIYYRRISVTVDWTGRLATTSQVQSDTVLSPNGRINDASTGSIAVQVTGSTGVGEAGVAISIQPYSGASQALPSQPAVTNVDGCSYALGVSPGTYTVTISRTASVDTKQSATSSLQVPVVAGATAPAAFNYDQSGQFSLTYASGSGATLPSTMPVTFLNAGAPYVTSSSTAAPTSATLYPYPAGYQALPGAVVDSSSGTTICAAENPASWATGPYGGKTLTAAAAAGTAFAAPGGTAASALTVPMGIFTVKPVTAVYLTVVAQNVQTYGQPGCAAAATASTAPTFTFPKLAANTTTTLALPYGTYLLYAGSTAGAKTTPVLTTMAATPLTTGAGATANGPLSGYAQLTSTLTLDPRPGS